jgi:hypothetical protein
MKKQNACSLNYTSPGGLAATSFNDSFTCLATTNAALTYTHSAGNVALGDDTDTQADDF